MLQPQEKILIFGKMRDARKSRPVLQPVLYSLNARQNSDETRFIFGRDSEESLNTIIYSLKKDGARVVSFL